MSKIKLVRETQRNRALDKEKILGVRLAAQLADGRVEEVVVHQPKGHPDAPLSDAELLEGVSSADTARRLLSICNNLSTPRT